MKRRRFIKWSQRFLIALFAVWITISLWQAPVVKTTASFHQNIRGVWLTNYGAALSYYTTRLDELTANLVQHHINTLYPAVWNRGATLHPSSVAKAAGGPRRNSLTALPLLPFQNTLKSLAHHAHRQNLRVIPWFEYGLWVPASSAIAQAHPDWLSTTLDGKITLGHSSSSHLPKNLRNLQQEWTGTNQAWLNPAHPEVQSFMTDLILEVVQNYEVDGIQLDDHFGIPVEFGYDDYTVQQYQKTHQGQTPPQNPNDPEWVAWRADQIKNFNSGAIAQLRFSRFLVSKSSSVCLYQVPSRLDSMG